MKNILRWVSWQKIVFLIVLGIVIFQNRITGNQYLSGWDNLQPEINFGLELSRQLSAVWQEFRGLGHLGGMGHAADLPRTLILWLFSWVVPTNFLRWGWHVVMLTLGPIGIWYMGRKLWKWGESASFTASMFYLLNMATVQYFYTPYEAFSAFYGFLPWLINSFALFLENGKKQDGVRLLFVSLLATTAFYVQTLFVVYVMLLFIISLGYLKHWTRVLTAGLIVFVANAFWLLPVIYFVISNAGVVGVSKINSIASPETAYMNEAMGGWKEVLSMKGFWLEYVEWKGKDWGRLLQVWQEWSGRNIVQILSLSIAGLSILGVVVGAIKKRISRWISVMFILTFVMLASNNPPFGFAYTYLTEKIPFFGEMFRSVFTKWSVVMGMVLALGLGVTVELARASKWLMTILTVVIVGAAGYIVWPVFAGNLIFQSMKVEYPNEYSQLYKFFHEQDKSGRIAYLPSAWAWGWQYNDWGYRGSGFLWYGIEQPILDRAFDVWSPYNEGFYNEFSTALYGGSGMRVSQVLNKYDVRYVLMDESVIAPGQGKEILRVEETRRIAEELGWEQMFKEGFLTVWDTGLGKNQQFVSTPDSYTLVVAQTNKVRDDVVYSEVGTYVSENTANKSIYPFSQLMQEEVKNVEWGDSAVRIINKEIGNIDRQQLVIPGWRVGEIVAVSFADNQAIPGYFVNGEAGPRFLGKERPKEGESYFFAKVGEGEEWEEYRQDQIFDIENREIFIEVKGRPFVYDFAKQGQGSIGNCDVLKRGVATKTESSYVANERGAVCDYVVMDASFTRVPYLLRLRGENVEGRSIKFFLWNTGSKRNDIEYLLGKGKFDQTFSLLPWNWDGYYTLNIETRSFGQRAENSVDPVVGMYVPIDKIARAKITSSKNSDQRVANNIDVTYIKKTGTWLYGLGIRGNGLIRLSQGYDEGWVGLLVESEKSKVSKLEHVKVDGWANGWVVSDQKTGVSGQAGEPKVVVIFYWPQLLEYLGFVILGATILVLALPHGWKLG